MNWYKTSQLFDGIDTRLLSKEQLTELRDLTSKMNVLSKEFADLYNIGTEDENIEKKTQLILDEMKIIDDKIKEIKKIPLEIMRKERKKYLQNEERKKKDTERRYKTIHKIGPKLEEYVRNYFSLTDDIRLAGYILQNGDMLSFSHGYNVRDIDHREVSEAFPEGVDIDSWTDGMLQFMTATGAVRVNAHGKDYIFDMMIPPTRYQMRIMTECLEKSGKVTVSMNRESKDFEYGQEEEMAEFLGYSGSLWQGV